MNDLQHIAIIMDGNRRWAKEKLLPQMVGHQKGADNLREISQLVWENGIKYLTVYAFSTENWKRSPKEVNYIMDLARKFLKTSIKDAAANNMRVRVIGNKIGLAQDIREQITELEKATVDFTGLNLQIALNYGGRDEIIRAAQKLMQQCKDGIIEAAALNEELFEHYLDTSDIPAPELLIRTGGESRVSNYLLWQIAYSEIYITNVFWPDFKEADLREAINFYLARNRRFGGE
ncbi:di-trans,poly-cis-decaprenylcistransferase [Clostridiales bacterium COT073_COT-073]|nr:di-trans,poly-cis-decaprenylcistransferase [Clostridiales bacterium COT073_COT-073]